MDGLGIQLESISFYIICFIITMFFLQKFLFTPVVEILNAREEEILKVQKEHEELDSKLALINEEAKSIIIKAQAEARGIIDEATSAVEPEKNRIIESAQNLGVKIVEDSRLQATEILNKAKFDAENESVELLKAIFTKSIQNLDLDNDIQDNIISSVIKNKL